MALRGIHHVQVNVTDVGRAVAFYESLGMAVRSDRPDVGSEGAWLDAGGQQLHLSKKESVPDGAGQHFALELDDLDAVLAALRARGIEANEPRSLGPGLGRQTVVRDPDGHPVELREPAEVLARG
ncbi:MAG TPA: VOC family protein [Candidatus Dormibacteraeota bacterium]|nr:VOC family protein [Candidatus Dormibacteraeota bacterium]